MFDKNYFLTRLQNGEDVQAIGDDIAEMINAAVADYNAEKEKEAQAKREAELANGKKALAHKLADLIHEYAMLVDPKMATELAQFTDEDVDMLVDALDATFQLAQLSIQLNAIAPSVKTGTPSVTVHTPKANAPKSDDEVLANFISKMCF